MKRELEWMLFVYMVILIALFGVHYLFLSRQGFDDSAYLTGLLMLLPAALVIGYIFLTQVLERQERHEERLEHLVREVLHEIKLPISTIEANLSMARRSIAGDRDKLLKRLDRIGAAAKRLQKLYRELAYNLRREIMPIEKEPFDLAQMIEERSAFFRELGRNELRLDLKQTVIEADRIGMEQVLDNLLENAMKYSEPSRPVEIDLHAGVLSIRDRGIGMDENELLRVYERYYQSDRRIRGEGIGLALVKRYCDENGITLKIRSQKGEGTEIRLYLERRLHAPVESGE